MSKEISRVTRGSVEPYNESVSDDLLPYAPMVPQSFDVPDYVVLKPPDTGKIQAAWSKMVTPTRAIALGYLWITLYWWRTAILISAIVTLIILLKMS